MLEIILDNLGVGVGWIFFSICLFLPPSGEDLNFFKMIVKKLTKKPLTEPKKKSVTSSFQIQVLDSLKN